MKQWTNKKTYSSIMFTLRMIIAVYNIYCAINGTSDWIVFLHTALWAMSIAMAVSHTSF